MYAVIEMGSKQYVVKEGDTLDVEKQDFVKGQALIIDKVLMYADGQNYLIGRPYVSECKVEADVMAEVKTKRAISFKYRRRKASKTTRGHRQQKLRIKIAKIQKS